MSHTQQFVAESYSVVFERLCRDRIGLNELLYQLYVNDAVWNDYEIGTILNYIQRKTIHKNEFIQLLSNSPEKINYNTLHILVRYVNNLFNELPLKSYGPGSFRRPDNYNPFGIPVNNATIVAESPVTLHDIDAVDEEVEQIDQNDLLCKICSVKKIEYVYNKCGHVVCERCLLNIINHADNGHNDMTTTCPYCRSRENVFVKLYL